MFFLSQIQKKVRKCVCCGQTARQGRKIRLYTALKRQHYAHISGLICICIKAHTQCPVNVYFSCSKTAASLSYGGEKHPPLPNSYLYSRTRYQYKKMDLHVRDKFMAASCTFFLRPFPCLSQLSRPSAVCFLLTFSSCAQTLPEVLLTEPGLWEWAGSQHWPEISSSNWISRRGGAITHTQR